YGFGIQGQGISCQLHQAQMTDLDLTLGGIFYLQYLDFINAPDTALMLGGNGSTDNYSIIAYSNFGQGGSGLGPDLAKRAENQLSGGVYQESGPETATRFTAIYLTGAYTRAYSNLVSYAGTAGITLEGANQFAYGNALLTN